MEQFSLGKYLADPARKVVTRDGRPVRIICTDMKNETEHPIVGLISKIVKNGKEVEALLDFSAKGDFYVDAGESSYDLFFAPKKQSRWVFLFYNFDGTLTTSVPYKTREEAEREMKVCGKANGGFALTEITWEE